MEFEALGFEIPILNRINGLITELKCILFSFNLNSQQKSFHPNMHTHIATK